jgi:hypothetical protein
MAPANQIVQEEVLADMDDAEQFGLMAQLVLAKQATFDKPTNTISGSLILFLFTRKMER